MMVNLIYLYDIISTMSSDNTVDETWTVCPDPKHHDKKKDELNNFIVNSVSIPGLSWMDMRYSNHTLPITEDRVKRFVGHGCPIELPILLINYMMKIGADITKDKWGNVKVIVKTFNHMKRHIDEAIQKMIDRSFFTNLSFEDAREIISRLKFEEYLYCFEGHHVSGICLVVLGPNVHTQDPYKQPWHLFQQEVRKMNASRTIDMSSEQEQRLINGNEEFRTSVEFTSAIDKTTRRVVFKRENLSIHIIRQMLQVEDLTTQLSKAKMELEKMVQLEEMRKLQERMFPKIE